MVSRPRSIAESWARRPMVPEETWGFFRQALAVRAPYGDLLRIRPSCEPVIAHRLHAVGSTGTTVIALDSRVTGQLLGWGKVRLDGFCLSGCFSKPQPVRQAGKARVTIR